MEYTITTIKELFNIINSENVERLLADLNNTIRHVSEIKEHYPVEVESFTWKDDNDVKSEVDISLKIIDEPPHFEVLRLCCCNIPYLNPYSNVPNSCLTCKKVISKNY